MEAITKTMAYMDDDKRTRGMDGSWVRRVLQILSDGSIVVSNGRTVRSVDPMSCILQAAK